MWSLPYGLPCSSLRMVFAVGIAQTHEGSLEDFRALYLTNGELIYKKQLMRDELEVQIQTREAQQVPVFVA